MRATSNFQYLGHPVYFNRIIKKVKDDIFCPCLSIKDTKRTIDTIEESFPTSYIFDGFHVILECFFNVQFQII